MRILSLDELMIISGGVSVTYFPGGGWVASGSLGSSGSDPYGLGAMSEVLAFENGYAASQSQPVVVEYNAGTINNGDGTFTVFNSHDGGQTYQNDGIIASSLAGNPNAVIQQINASGDSGTIIVTGSTATYSIAQSHLNDFNSTNLAGSANGTIVSNQHFQNGNITLKTPGGHFFGYNPNLALTAEKIQIAEQIVDYGYAHGGDQGAIRIALADAYYESSFKQSAVNGSHIGLFQYNQQTWDGFGESGSLNNAGDQIAAIFNDISNFENRFADGVANNKIPNTLSFAQYFEIKHELGNSSTNWYAINPLTQNRYIDDWNTKYAELNPSVAR